MQVVRTEFCEVLSFRCTTHQISFSFVESFRVELPLACGLAEARDPHGSENVVGVHCVVLGQGLTMGKVTTSALTDDN